MIATHTVLQSRYRIDELIDRGGMADVYRGRDVRLERDVAVKVLREVEHERRFAAEARTLARLQHPNLVRLLDAGTDNGDAFLVLSCSVEHGAAVDGAPLPTGGASARAMRSTIHRRGSCIGTKPSNLMLDDYGSTGGWDRPRRHEDHRHSPGHQHDGVIAPNSSGRRGRTADDVYPSARAIES
jgi:hypothetical protein